MPIDPAFTLSCKLHHEMLAQSTAHVKKVPIEMPHAVEQRSIALSMNFIMPKVDPT